MKATLYFFYADREYSAYSSDTDRTEADVCYWLGKNKGRPNLKEILSISEAEHKSWLWVEDKLREEELAYEMKIADQEERNEYERLKAKYEG